MYIKNTFFTKLDLKKLLCVNSMNAYKVVKTFVFTNIASSTF